MTGPEHVHEALRLAGYAEQEKWATEWGEFTPTDEQRDRVMMRAHLHASLARTAAMVDTIRWSDGSIARRSQEQDAWHEVFGVRR